MADYVTLMGSENVERAGYAIREAGSQMDRAAGNLEDSLHRHRMFMTEWIERFEAALASQNKTTD